MEFSREQRLAIIVIVALGLVAIGIGSAHKHFSASQKVEFVQAGSGPKVSPAEDAPPKLRFGRFTDKVIVIHVAGHVKQPGMYTMKDGSRIGDAVRIAKGPTQDAALDAVNLAAKLEDGVQVYIPSKKELQAPPTAKLTAPKRPKVIVVTKSPTPGPPAERITPDMWQQPGSSTTAPAVSSGSSSKSKLTDPSQGSVNINTAGLDELQRLPGVGPSTAQKILDYRTAHGPFQTPEGLMDVKGIGPAKFEKMKAFVRI